MLSAYAGALILLGLGALVGVALVILPILVAPSRPREAKGIPYESGMDPVGSTRERFSVKFYQIAMLFVVLDVDLALMYPWVVQAKPLGFMGLIAMGGFVLVLGIGYLYVWRKGLLAWDK
ncbi:MAG: NADH-quinone oxidoreductase subunit A [Bacteroidia bacterium]